MEPSPTDIPHQGRLEDFPLPHLLARLFDAQAYGMLTLETGSQSTWIYLDEGMPAGVDNPNAEVYLGMLLEELGYITHDDFNESLMQMAKTGKLQGQVLIDMGKIDEEQLDHALQLQMIRKVAGLMVRREGEFRFSEDQSPPARLIPFPVHPYAIIYNGITSHYTEADLARQLGPLESKAWRLSVRFTVHESGLRLTPEDRTDVGMLDDFRMPDHFYRRTMSGPVRARMLLLCLYHCGLLEAGQPDQAADAPAAQPKPQTEKPPAQRPAAAAKPPQKTVQASARPVERPEQPAQPRTKPDEAARFLRLLQRKAEQARSGDVLGLLDITRETSAEKLEESYLRLAKAFHPDRASQLQDENARKQMSYVFARINEAYQELLKSGGATPGARAQAQSSSSNAEASRVAAKKAEVYQKKKQWRQALDSMLLAKRLDPNNPGLLAEVLWLGYLASETDREAKLEQVQERLFKLANQHPDNFIIARRLATACHLLGDQKNYEKYLDRSAHLNPKDIDVARELRLLTSRKQKDPGDKTLFGIKYKK